MFNTESAGGVYLGWNLVREKDIAIFYFFLLSKPFSEPLYPVDGVTAIQAEHKCSL